MWALMGAGFRCVIGPSFGDIFFENCFKNGVLAVVLPADQVAELRRQLPRAARRDPCGRPREPDPSPRPTGAPTASRWNPSASRPCSRGQDEIALTLEYAREIEAFEARHASAMPWLALRTGG